MIRRERVAGVKVLAMSARGALVLSRFRNALSFVTKDFRHASCVPARAVAITPVAKKTEPVKTGSVVLLRHWTNL